MDQKKKRYWFNEKTILVKKVLFFNLIIIISIIFFLEILIRLLNIVELQGYDKDVYYLENDIILNKPNKIFKVSGKQARTDENGFRIPLNDFSYDRNKGNILILGDSVTFGVGVKETDSFIGQLRKTSNKNLYNTSIVGHNLKSYLYIVEQNFNKPGVRFDEIVIFICLNDIVPFQGVVSKKGSAQLETNKHLLDKYFKNNLTLKINLFFREKSSLFVLFKSLLTSPVKRHYQYMNSMYKDENNIKEFENYILKIKKFSKQNQLNLKFVLLPYTYQIINDCKIEVMKPQNEIKKIFGKLNLVYHDFSKKFCENTNQKKLFLPFDPVHLSKYGHEYVSNLLIENKVIK